MNERIIWSVAQAVGTIIEKFGTDYILLTGNNDDIVLPVAWLISRATGLPTTPRRSEEALSVACGYLAYRGITLLPEIDDLDDMREEIFDFVMSISDKRHTQPTYEKAIDIPVLVVVIDDARGEIASMYIPDFPNTKLE